MENTKEIKYLGEGAGKVIVNEINELRKRVDNIVPGTGGEGSGGDVDLSGYIKKGTSSEKLVQENGTSRPIFDSADLDTGNNTDIPTVRAVKNELNNYPKKEALEAYEKIEDLMSKLTNLKSEILGGAGEDYDTLKKIEEWVVEHQDIYLALVSTISEKADTVYVNDELGKLLAEINKKSTVVVCDNQYEFDQIKTKDLNTIYLIKGDQDQWFSKEDGDELYDFYGELRERVAHLERLNGITDYDNED